MPFKKGNKIGSKTRFQKGHLPFKTAFKKGQIGYWKGKKLPLRSKETREKISKALKGKRSGAWKGGITSLNRMIRTSGKYAQWRSDIFKRDGWVCQTCGERGCYLEAHHIKEFYKLIKEYKIKTLQQAIGCSELWNINNGVTLCKDCHRLTKKGRMKKYGDSYCIKMG